MRRRRQKRVVELTALLDLLFMMVFISLAQSKQVPPKVEVTEKPKEEKVEVVQEKKSVPEPQGRVAVAATFHFYGTSTNPGIPQGKYRMEGTFNYDTGSLHLGGSSWIDKPENYDMVPLSGIINHERSLFKGAIEFPNCNQFTLRKVSSTGATPVSGEWKGEYNCSQGDTGLTLTIE